MKKLLLKDVSICVIITFVFLKIKGAKEKQFKQNILKLGCEIITIQNMQIRNTIALIYNKQEGLSQINDILLTLKLVFINHPKFSQKVQQNYVVKK